jgi:hypothetical protein
MVRARKDELICLADALPRMPFFAHDATKSLTDRIMRKDSINASLWFDVGLMTVEEDSDLRDRAVLLTAVTFLFGFCDLVL